MSHKMVPTLKPPSPLYAGTVAAPGQRWAWHDFSLTSPRCHPLILFLLLTLFQRMISRDSIMLSSCSSPAPPSSPAPFCNGNVRYLALPTFLCCSCQRKYPGCDMFWFCIPWATSPHIPKVPTREWMVKVGGNAPLVLLPELLGQLATPVNCCPRGSPKVQQQPPEQDPRCDFPPTPLSGRPGFQYAVCALAPQTARMLSGEKHLNQVC